MDEPTDKATASGELRPIQLASAVAWALVVLVVGGYFCGLAIDAFAEIGSISLWALGAGAGFVGRKIVIRKSRLAGSLLVLACIGAFVIAEVCWIHWNIIQGQESWIAAIKLIPRFLQQYTITTLIGALFCAFGASAAYRQVAVRYRIVRVVEE